MALLATLKKHLSFFKGNALTISVSWIFIVFSNSITSVYYSKYLQALGAGPFIIGLLATLYLYLVSISRIIGGYISDRWGRRKIICILTYVIAFVQLLYATAPSWEWIILAVVITSFALTYQTALDAMVADSIPPENRGIGFSIVHFISYLPSIFAPYLIISLVIAFDLEHGVRIAYFLSFILILIAAIIRNKFLKETLTVKQKQSTNGLLELIKDVFVKFKEAIKRMDKSLARLIIAYSAYTFSLHLASRFWILYTIDELGFSIVEWGLITWAGFSIGILLMVPIGVIIEKIGRLKSFFLGSIGTSIFSLIYITSKSFLIAIVSYTLISLWMLLALNAFVALRADLMPRELRGRLIAATMIVINIINAPASMIGGYLFEYVNPMLPFIIFAILTFFTGVFSIITVKEPKTRYA